MNIFMNDRLPIMLWWCLASAGLCGGICGVASAQDAVDVPSDAPSVIATEATATSAEATTEQTFVTPPAPVLQPQQSMETMQIVDGYRIELVAAEPLIQDPVAITFDPNGRIWVCEMRGFMSDIEGTGEDEPVGVISVLDDTDGDGVMDKSAIFLDGLVLPRGLCWTLDGILVCENGNIWLCADHDRDDHCDDKKLVCRYSPGNLEHALNGLMPALDNCIYNAKEGIRLRRTEGKWLAETIAARGQWGITQDNYGYLHYNVNASLIRGDLVPCYSPIAASRNPLVDVQLYDDQIMYPIRPTPGINRGYLPGFLRPDGSLIEANSNCGPVIYRGDNLPDELIGNVFIPEPAGNLIRRQVLVHDDLNKHSHNAYHEREFLASTDERFRPVNMFNAPDGTLYIVDMYRGIIQHGAFITSYLRDQILDRQLDEGIHLGRIYRIVHESSRPRRPPALSQASGDELVSYLSSANGWHRDVAQQLIVQRADMSMVPALEQVAASGESPLARLHALWSLAGLDRLDPDLLQELLADEDANVRASAVTLYQRFLRIETFVYTVMEDASELMDDVDPLVRLQAAATLGLIRSSRVNQAIESILRAAAADERLLGGLLGAFAGSESEFLAARLSQPDWNQQEAWRQRVLEGIGGIMWNQRSPIAVLKFCEILDAIAPEQSWQQIALLEGAKDAYGMPPRPRFTPPPPREGASVAADRATERNPVERNPLRGALPAFARRGLAIRLDIEPVGLERLRASADPRLAAAAQTFADKLVWPGKDGRPLPEKPVLNESQQRLFEIGKREYSTLCAGCHHAAGYGLAAKGPPLLGSPWLEHEQRLIRVVLHGIQGPIDLGGETYNTENRISMPGMFATLDDEKIAGVLTYVRREFSEDLPPVATQTVQQIRNVEQRTELWTEGELLRSVP